MNKDSYSNAIKFQIVFQEASNKRLIYPIEKVRMTIGSSDVCDIQIKKKDISAIHAVIEIQNNKVTLFDMSSTNGSYVDGQRIVVKELTGSLKFFLSNHEFNILDYREDDIIPPLLQNLPKGKSKVNDFPKKLPSPPGIAKTIKNELPKIVFPLGSDPCADKVEYIFEDADLIIPIFNYDSSKIAVEVVIIFNELVYSIDYLPNKNGVFQISGVKKNTSHVEFPYFGVSESLPFIEIKDTVFVHPLPGFEGQVLGDKADTKFSNLSPVLLNSNDIVRFKHKHLQIFIRKTDAPPRVDSAPLFDKNNDLNKYLLLMMFFAFAVTVSFNLIEIEKPIEKDLTPERIASIIYKKPEKIEKSKEIVSSSEQKTQNVAPVDKIADKIPEKITGSKTAPEIKITKKATPPPAAQNNLKTSVVRPRPSPHLAKIGKLGGVSAKVPIKALARSQGIVETFNIAGLHGSLNSLLSKGGGTKSAINLGVGGGSGRGNGGEADGIRGSLYDSGGPGATLQRSKVTGEVGSLAGSAQGSMDISKGAEGISDKKNIYTAGLPYRTIILGGLDPEIIRKILIEHLEQFRFCYQKQLDIQNKSFSGIVKMNFIIGATGNVTKAAIEAGDSNIPTDIRSCVGNVLKGIQFPAPRGGGVVEVDQPFNFYPRNK